MIVFPAESYLHHQQKGGVLDMTVNCIISPGSTVIRDMSQIDVFEN